MGRRPSFARSSVIVLAGGAALDAAPEPAAAHATRSGMRATINVEEDA